MEQDDEEFEQLLGEIPQAISTNTANEIQRAMSAPPHLRPHGSQVEEGPFKFGGDEEASVQPCMDIRCDEHYEDFYRSYSGGKKLPPPVGIRTMYNDLPVVSPKSASVQLSAFYSGLALDSPRTNQRQPRQLEMEHKQQHVLQLQQREPSHNHQVSMNHHHHSSQNRLFADSHSLAAPFGNLSFVDNSAPAVSKRGVRLHNEDNGDSRVLSNGSLNGIGGGPISNGHSPPVSNGFYAHLEDMAVGAGGFGSDRGATLESYASKSPSSPDLLRCKPAEGMDALSHGTYNGMDEYSQACAQMLEKIFRQRSPGLAVFSTVRGSSIPTDTYGSGGSPLLQQQQQQQQPPATAPTSGGEFYPTASSHEPIPRQYDLGVASFLQTQRAQVQVAAAVRAQIEEENRHRQHLVLQQQLTQHQNQLRFLVAQQAQASEAAGGRSYSRGGTSTGSSRNSSCPQHTIPDNAHQSQVLQRQLLQHQAVNHNGIWSSHTGGSGLGHSHSSGPTSTTSLCHCSRGDVCPFLHLPTTHGNSRGSHLVSGSMKEAVHLAAGAAREVRRPAYPDKILPSSWAHRAGPTTIPLPSEVVKIAEVMSNAHGQGYGNEDHSPLSGCILQTYPSDSSTVQGQAKFDIGRHLRGQLHHLQLQQEQQSNYTKLEEVEGRIYIIAKDQHGCRFLQRKFDEGSPEDVHKIFKEIIGHISELMKDPFGNYLVQKLLEVCSEEQRMEILHAVTVDRELLKISLNMHGTRAVQKLIETLKSPEQVVMVITALAGGVVGLVKDVNGNHVVQRCLQKLSHDNGQFIFDAAAAHCVEIATHRHGCCVMQRCVDFASGPQRQRLVAEVAANALVLSQDKFGNYVVQYILDLKTPQSSTEVMVRLEGNYASLACQKYSSNVVEKCLKFGVEEHRSRLVRELMTSPRLGQLLQDEFANYVIQSALSVSKGALYSGLVEAIHPHVPAFRNSPFSKRILSRLNLKK